MSKTILMVSALDPKDRGAQSLEKTIKAYLDDGYKVFFLTYSKAQDNPDYFYEAGPSAPDVANFFRCSLDLPLTFLDSNRLWRKLSLATTFPFFAFLRAREILRSEHVDLLYGYEVHGVLACSLIRKLYRLPMVSRFQGTILKPFLKAGGKFPLKYFDHVAALRYPADLVIMTNDGTFGDKVLERLGADMSKVRFWMNGVPKDLYNPKYRDWVRSRYRIASSTKVLLTLSRLARWKRVDRAIRALRFVLDKGLDVVLVVVGDGSERKPLEDLAINLGVGDNVIFAGSAPHRDISKYLNSCDAFLSLYDLSNLGNPVLEAMSCGRCVLAINHGEMTQIIKNGRDGVLVDAEDKMAVGEQLFRLLGDDCVRKFLGESALRRAQRDFWSWEDRMYTELDVVEKMLE